MSEHQWSNRKLIHKNWIAFKVLIDAVIEDRCGFNSDDKSMPTLDYVIDKFNRYVLSSKADEYKWGLHPLLYKRLYDAFGYYGCKLDSNEMKALERYKSDEANEYNNHFEFRWVDE